MFQPLVLLFGINLLVHSQFASSLKCHECVDDDCEETQLTECDENAVGFNMLGLQQVYKGLKRTASQTYECLHLIYEEPELEQKDITSVLLHQANKKLYACVESGISYCDFPLKDGVNLFKCDRCLADCDTVVKKVKQIEKQKIEPFSMDKTASLAMKSRSNVLLEFFATIMFKLFL